jgi:hypothetical protein
MFIAVDNKDGYVLNPEGYVSFGRYFYETNFKKVDTPIVIPTYRSIKVNYINPTDSKPARVRLTDMESGQTVVIPHEETSYLNDGGMYLNRRGIRIVGRSRIKGGYILSVDTFDVPIV